MGQLHSSIMCLHAAWRQGGENYYFQMFLPEVAWSRSERETGCWSSILGPALHLQQDAAPTPTPTPPCHYGRVGTQVNQRAEQDRRGSERLFLARFWCLGSPTPVSLAGGVLLPPVAQETCCGEMGRPRPRVDSAASDLVLFSH